MPRRSSTSPVSSRDAILTVAVELFAERGYHATSMREVAQRVGVVPAALYNHFDGKDAIFVELGTRYFDAMYPALEAARHAEGDAADRLAAMVAASVNTAAGLRAEHMMLTDEWRTIRRSEALSVLAARRRACIDLWHEVLAEGAVDGSLRTDVDDSSIIWLLFAAITSLVDSGYWSDIAVKPSPPLDDVCSVILDGVRRS
ncbi:MAG: TetR/AcrR family transcriptional regulator [Nocardioidaceae bacterium]|nr:TetR/AcrR family transcriptional regulator [Nocardioidaceae bacterium]